MGQKQGTGIGQRGQEQGRVALGQNGTWMRLSGSGTKRSSIYMGQSSKGTGQNETETEQSGTGMG